MNNPLTDQERCVMLLLSSGEKCKEIARTLGTTESTVRSYTMHARHKLDAKTTIQAAVLFDRIERNKVRGP